MPWLERVRSDSAVLLRLARGMPRRGDPGERLQRFYAGQADSYDAFRERLLAGRRELIESLRLKARAHVVELGAGTGANVDWFEPARRADCTFELVDLCRPLLEVAARRHAGRANISIVEADAATWQSARKADLVLLSYALSMMPHWRAVLANCDALLAPRGRIAVVDFYVSAREPRAGLVRHSAPERWFWPRWFRHDGVELSPDRLAALRAAFPTHRLSEHRHALPYLRALSVPYFRFVGERAPFDLLTW